MSRTTREYKRIARKLTLAKMQAEPEHDDFFTLDDLISDGRFSQKTDYFMGLISKQGMLNVFNAFHITEVLSQHKLNDISVEIDTYDPHIHRLYVYTGSHIPDNIICELVLHRGPNREILHTYSYLKEINPSILNIEWLLLQNPRASFSEKKMRLPGQSRPGLGMGSQVLLLMIFLAKRLNLEAVACIPRFFHTAFIFSRVFKFVDPVQQGKNGAMNRDLLQHYSLHTVAWAANFNSIINTNSEQKVEWQPSHLLHPINRKVMKYFSQKEWVGEYQKALNESNYRLNINDLRRQASAYDIQIKID